jgi:hypothetical protein
VRSASKPLLFAIAIAALGTSAVLLGPRLLDLAGGPDAALGAALTETEREGLRLVIPGSPETLVARRHHFDRISTHLEPDGNTGYAISTLDFTGALGATVVSSLGLERTTFQRGEGGWRPANGFAPLLAAIVSALEARRQILESGDSARRMGLLAASSHGGDAPRDPFFQRLAAIGNRRYQVLSWYIRSERDRAEVREDYHLTGTLRGGPVDEKGARRMTLQRRDSQFLFAEGLL